MSTEQTLTEALTEGQGILLEEHRYGIIRVSHTVMVHLDTRIDFSGCTLQGEYADKGVFASLHDRLLLPASYVIKGIFMRWGIMCWDVVVENPDLPILEFGYEPPQITPIYEVTYEVNGQHSSSETTRSVRLKEMRIEGR